MPATAESMAAKRARRKVAGLCTECETPALQGHSVCQRHLDQRRRIMERFNTNRQAEGRCYCGEPVAPQRDRCPACLRLETQRMTAVYAERKAGGLCVWCGKRKPRRGKVQCRVCADRAARRYQEQKVWRLAAEERRLRRESRKGQLLRMLGNRELSLY